MKYKLLCVIFCLLITMSMSSLALEESIIEIKNPQNGSKTEYTISSFVADVSGDITKVLFRLDDKDIGIVEVKDGEAVFDTVENEIEIEVGKHVLEVMAVGDGEYAYAKSVFDAVKSVDVVVMDNDFQTFQSFGSNSGVVGNKNDTQYILAAETFEGPDGEGDKAVGFRVPDGITNGQSTTLFFRHTVSYQNKLTIEYDMKIFDYFTYNIEYYGLNGNYSYIHMNRYLINTDGIIAGTVEVFPKDKWVHVKHVIDFNEHKGSMWISYDSATKHVLDNIDDGLGLYPSGEALTGISTIKFQAEGINGNNPNQGFAIDNVKITQQDIYYGFDKSYIKNGESYDVVSEIPGNISEFKLTAPTIFKETAKIDGAGLYFNDKEISADISVVGDGVIIKTKEPLKYQKTYTLKIPKTVVLDDNTALGADMKYSFTTNVGDKGISCVTFELDGREPYSRLLLKGGKSILASVALNNPEGENLMAFLAVYCDGELVSCDGKEIVDACSLSTQIPVGFNENLYAEVFVIDSFATRKAYSTVWQIK